MGLRSMIVQWDSWEMARMKTGNSSLRLSSRIWRKSAKFQKKNQLRRLQKQRMKADPNPFRVTSVLRKLNQQLLRIGLMMKKLKQNPRKARKRRNMRRNTREINLKKRQERLKRRQEELKKKLKEKGKESGRRRG